jgi:hypothetical protein
VYFRFIRNRDPNLGFSRYVFQRNLLSRDRSHCLRNRKEIHSKQTGIFAGWLWALSPYTAILPYIRWDTALSAMLGRLALLLTLRLALAASRKLVDWLVCGAIWGVAAQVNPALLSRLPILAILLLDRGRKWRQVFVMAACYNFVDHSLDYSELRRLP